MRVLASLCFGGLIGAGLSFFGVGALSLRFFIISLPIIACFCLVLELTDKGNS